MARGARWCRCCLALAQVRAINPSTACPGRASRGSTTSPTVAVRATRTVHATRTVRITQATRVHMHSVSCNEFQALFTSMRRGLAAPGRSMERETSLRCCCSVLALVIGSRVRGLGRCGLGVRDWRVALREMVRPSARLSERVHLEAQLSMERERRQGGGGDIESVPRGAPQGAPAGVAVRAQRSRCLRGVRQAGCVSGGDVAERPNSEGIDWRRTAGCPNDPGGGKRRNDSFNH